MVIAVLGGAAVSRDRRLGVALYAIALGAAFWAVTVYLPLMPRYLYTFTAPASILLAGLTFHAAERSRKWLGERWSLAAALGIGLLWCAWNVREVRRMELVWFDYLSTPTRKLFALYEERRTQGAMAPLRVRLAPYRLLGDADAAFFSPTLDIVKGGTAEVIVDDETARFVAYFGEDFGSAYWYFPWLER
jgi:hypothetical protein